MFREVTLQTSSDIYVYREENKIGEGGFGCVYVGRGLGSGMEVAIKRPHFYSDESLERFKRKECRYLPLLRHRYIIRVLDVLTDVRNERGEVGPPALIMEYIDGENLQVCRHDRIHRLSLMQKLAVFKRICEGVDYAHHKGIVHRDLKPGNILLTREGIPKIIDFGLAATLDPRELKSLSQTQKFIGSLLYMAPEQHEAMPADERSDIYSLGLILFFIFTGWHAKERLLKGQYTLQQIFDKYLPGQISEICKSMCQLDKSKRMRHIHQLSARLPADVAGWRDAGPVFRYWALLGVATGLSVEQLFNQTQLWSWALWTMTAFLVAMSVLSLKIACRKCVEFCAIAFWTIVVSYLVSDTFFWKYLVAAAGAWGLILWVLSGRRHLRSRIFR